MYCNVKTFREVVDEVCVFCVFLFFPKLLNAEMYSLLCSDSQDKIELLAWFAPFGYIYSP